MAKQFEDHGIQYLHLVDLDGAKSKHIVNYKILEKIATKTGLKVDFGGGLKSDEDIFIAFDNGAIQVTVGSIAAQQPELFLKWLSTFGQKKIILGADCKDRKISTNGWLETSEVDVLDFIKDYEKKGIKHVICTDIAKDGMLEGPSIALYKDIIGQTNTALIASGGVSSLKDLEELLKIGCEGAIIGKAIYEGNISLPELSTLC